MKEKTEIEKNASTEEKIKEAARKVFTQKGYAATRTRDIAEESGLNLALINYYFRSKENLFDIIMVENIQLFMHSIADILNDRDTTLKEKISVLIGHYIDMLMRNPQMPIFILNEINTNPGKLVEKIGLNIKHDDLFIVQQWKEVAKKNGLKINPIHIVMNVVGMTIFPFMGGPLLRNRTGISMEEFNVLMEERKTLIPVWIGAILKSSV